MFNIRESWIKIGCFLTGYNYFILKNCSEVSKKSVKKYTAAMIIMCLLWGIIGYSFANRYLHASASTSMACSLVFIIVIIQIERQIIMQTHKNNYLQIFRGVIAVMMAIIGSIIIDQIIFKDDIELEKEQFINNKIEIIYPSRASIRQKQIDQLKNQLNDKNKQRVALNAEIQNNPVINTTTTQSSPVPVTYSETDTVTGKMITRTQYVNKATIGRSQIPNPNIALIAPLDSQINSLQRMILSQGDSLSNLRSSIERTLKEKTGFLDELNIMFSLLGKSVPALVVYLIWFFLLLGLEFFILMNKRHEKATDYDAMIAHQMDMHVKKLNLLSGR
ncbi:MAG: DUF4407 domain-containing protein [Chitinophagaceae bacterium]|nr:DUF4407 domain-containing protein [Chitinophagaceae bacterium]